MPSWYFGKHELRKTPSIVDGLDPDTETRYRRDGARFIHEIGNKLGLQSETKATGIIYFHRFYMFHSFRDFPRYVTACCCLFLAGKVEETPKKCRDIIKNARSELTDQQFAQFGDDPREEVMTLERILLQTVRFDLQVDNPYRYIVKYAKSLRGNKEKLQSIVQSAWTFVNDSLCTTLCLQWEPEIIAIALMYLASKFSKFEVQDWIGKTSEHEKWWDMFVEGLSIELLEDICHQVLDLYSSTSTAGSVSPPNQKELAKSVASESSGIPSQKIQKLESPQNGKTPPMPSSNPKPETKTMTVVPVAVPITAPITQPIIPSVTPTVVPIAPPVAPPMALSVVVPIKAKPLTSVASVPGMPIAAQPPPIAVKPPLPINVVSTNPQNPPPPSIPQPTNPYPSYQYPVSSPTMPASLPITTYSNANNIYHPLPAVPAAIPAASNVPTLHPPPLPPPSGAHFHKFMPPPGPASSASFQPNFQQYPSLPGSIPPNQFQPQFNKPPPAFSVRPPPGPQNMRPPSNF